jgi:ActR/RegA family two-component response regulator
LPPQKSGLGDVVGRNTSPRDSSEDIDAQTLAAPACNIATAVEAVKLGAVDYLLKPVDADGITSALLAPRGGRAKAPSRPMSADRVRWEHIHWVYEACGRNVSETARRLNMHRRTLQRILTRRAGLLERVSSAGAWVTLRTSTQ